VSMLSSNIMDVFLLLRLAYPHTCYGKLLTPGTRLRADRNMCARIYSSKKPRHQCDLLDDEVV
jgi:hypothetical protein